MKLAMRIYDNHTGEYAEANSDLLMEAASLNAEMKYEDFGIQSDGTLVIFDKCGNFGYLDCGRFELQLMME